MILLYRRKSLSKAHTHVISAARAAMEPLECRRLFAAGDLDTTFGVGGRIAIPFPVATQPGNDDFIDRGVQIFELDSRNNQTVVIGQHFTGSREAGSPVDDKELAIARLDANGQLDATFDGDGMMYVPSISSGVGDVHVQSDNKILLIARPNVGSDDTFLYRFNADGSPDTGFGGGDGIVGFDFEPGEIVQAPDGKIILSGMKYIEAADTTVLVAARLLNDGGLDESYGEDGVAVTNFPHGSGEYLAVQPNNGKAILASSIIRQANPIEVDVGLLRLNNNGKPDDTFSGNGTAFVDSDQFDEIQDMDIGPDGDIYVALSGGSQLKTTVVLTKVGSGGTQGPLFEAIDVNAFASGVRAAFDSSGKVYVFAQIATAPDELEFHNAIICYNANGTLDRTFGTSGKGYIFTEDETHPTSFECRADLQSDMKIVVVKPELEQGVEFHRAVVSRRLTQDVTSPPTSPPPTSPPPTSPPPTSPPPTSPPPTSPPPTSPPPTSPPPPVGALPGTFSGTLTTTLPAGLIGQQKIKGGRVVVAVTNPGSTLVRGKTDIAVFISTDGTFDGDDRGVAEKSPNLKLKPGQTKNVRIPIKLLPVSDAGTYQLLAKVIAPDQTASDVAGDVTFPVAAPVVDLSGTIIQSINGTVAASQKVVVKLTVQNLGNVPAKDALSSSLAASTDALDSVDDILIATRSGNVNVKPGKSKTINVSFRVPSTLAAGTYFVVAKVDTQSVFAEPDEANNIAISSGTFTVV